jgi:hypothetical protein
MAQESNQNLQGPPPKSMAQAKAKTGTKSKSHAKSKTHGKHGRRAVEA